jgi:hypothetical protein
VNCKGKKNKAIHAEGFTQSRKGAEAQSLLSHLFSSASYLSAFAALRETLRETSRET